MFASNGGGRSARLRVSSQNAARHQTGEVTAEILRLPRRGRGGVQAEPARRGEVTEKIARFLETVQPETPCLVVDLDVVEQSFVGLQRSLQPARVYYAVKANPAPEILRMIARLGARFDVASRGEIDHCLGLGFRAADLSFGNTIKKERDIAYAYEKGVRLFAFDSDEELEKLARSAPGARVFCRVLVDGEGAEWPLSRKFGCSQDMAVDLLVKAKALGLDAAGISFHIGSQQVDLTQWDKVLGQVKAVFDRVAAAGIHLTLLNLGGGFPSRYTKEVPSIAAYGATVMAALRKHFGANLPDLIVEPGRGVVGDAGVIEAEVVLVSQKDAADEKRWVYLDIGKFGGLAETLEEAIRYRITTPHDGSATGPVVLAGPTCDSADILYEKTAISMPLALKAGDKVRILSCGAYTTTYAAVNFNGFKPLTSYCI